MFEVNIDKKGWEEALKRNEEAFDKELEKIQSDEKELKKMILKMKKSIIEQARKNDSTNRHARDAVETTNSFYKRMDVFEKRITSLSSEVSICVDTFQKSIVLLKQQQEEMNKPRGLKGFWEFIKCLIKR